MKKGRIIVKLLIFIFVFEAVFYKGSLFLTAAVSEGQNMVSVGLTKEYFNKTALRLDNVALKIGFSKRNTYYPTDILRGDKGKSDVTAVNVVNIEDYIRGLVPLEMNHAWNMSALKAQAVCVRSFGAAVSGFGSDSDIKKDIS